MKKNYNHITRKYSPEIKSLLYIIEKQFEHDEHPFPIRFHLPDFLDFSERYRLTPLIFGYFKNNRNLNGTETFTRLRELTISHSLKSLTLLNELLTICKKLNEAAVGYAVIKGPQLSHFLYSDATTRVCVDLDIFLEHSDSIGQVAGILRSLGYTVSNLPEKESGGRVFFRIGKHEIWFFKRNTRTHIDLHYRLVRNSFFSDKYFRLFFENTHPYEINGTELKIPDNEKYFLFLCYHGVAHSFSSLHWLNDVYVFLHKIPVNRQKMEAEAKQLRQLLSVKITYAVLHELFHVPVPDGFRNEQSFRFRFLVSNCLKRFGQRKEYGFSLTGRMEKTIYQILLSENFFAPLEILISIAARYLYRFNLFLKKVFGNR